MIDIENKVIGIVKAALTAAGKSTINVSSTYVETPQTFPWVYVAQESNTTYKKTQDNDNSEHHARVAFTAVTYSNKTPGHRAEAKELAEIIDTAMQGIKFTRTDYNAIAMDRNTTRVVLRYSAIVQEPVVNGNNKTYQIYRK